MITFSLQLVKIVSQKTTKRTAFADIIAPKIYAQAVSHEKIKAKILDKFLVSQNLLRRGVLPRLILIKLRCGRQNRSILCRHI